MCRFVSYIGKTPLVISQLLDQPVNSLINQSRAARDGSHGINADGFGLAWYDASTGDGPGTFKSTQPAWNDSNLLHLADKIRSTCFLSHVRASTVGDVNFNNCHPFYYKQYSFVHNGTIRQFCKIKRALLNKLDDDLYEEIKGQTDSEHLFFLIMQFLKDNPEHTLAMAVQQAFNWVINQQEKADDGHYARLNIVITDGKQLIATRFVSKGKDPLSLNYSLNNTIARPEDTTNAGASVIIASEPLTDYAPSWEELPVNHYLLVDDPYDTIQVRALG